MAKLSSFIRVGAVIAALGAATFGQAAETCDAPKPSTGSRPMECGLLPTHRQELRLNLGGVSAHSHDTAASGHHWNETHPGIGVELRTDGLPWAEPKVNDPWQTSYVVGAFTDSRDVWSGYAGSAVTHQLATWGRTRLDVGAGAFVFYRSDSWSGHRRWTPALLPVATFTDLEGPLGFNILWRPPGTGGPATLFLQITYRIWP
jgi:hypothetical protein